MVRALAHLAAVPGAELSDRLATLGRYWRTARHLRLRQVAGWARARWPVASGPVASRPVPVRQRTGEWIEGYLRPASMLHEGRVRLLNREATIVDWNAPQRPRLWNYHLHYFEDPRVPAEWIARWMAENPVGVGAGWEPYPLSRRVVNWIRWRGRVGEEVTGFDESLAMQARALAGQVEYRLMANHLFANAKALVYAGTYFEGPEAEGWLALGLSLLDEEMREQVLADGGHFERSPMYHALVLEDLLDLEGLRLAYPGVWELRTDWLRAMTRMAGWLRAMTHPDGGIAFFQDAGLGGAPSDRALVSYAERLGLDLAGVATLSDSGYRRLERGELVVLFDGGGVGPCYQPGHAHAGTLSLELSWRGERVVVNSGTSTYEEGAERAFERSTAAHATVRVDGRDSSEMWGAFRVGRRARVTARREGEGWTEATHDGYAPVRHRRRVTVDGASVTVADSLTGGELLEWFFPLHPGVEARGLELWRAGWRVGRVTAPLGVTVAVEAAEWRPEFYRRIPAMRLRFTGSGAGEYVTRFDFA